MQNHLACKQLTLKTPIMTAAEDRQVLRHLSQFSTKKRYDIT